MNLEKKVKIQRDWKLADAEARESTEEYLKEENEVNSINCAENSSKINTEKCPLELVK